MNIKEDAIRTYDRLKKENSLFPHLGCKFAVRAMNQLGYGIILGRVKLDNYCDLGMEQFLIHYWSYDPDSGEEADLTSEQFNIHLKKEGRLPKILVWSPDKKPKNYEEIRRGLEAHEVI